MVTALKFYRLLGIDVPSDQEKEPHVEFVTPGGFRIAWDTLEVIKGLEPDWVQPMGQRMTLAFHCDSSAEVDSLYKKITGSGYKSHKAPWDAFWGQRYAVVIDPDGNHVDLYAAL